MNNTKVFPARIAAFKPDGGMLEILLVRHMEDTTWEVLSRGNYTGSLSVSDELQIELHEAKTAHFICRGDLMEVIWKYGAMPLPPYIKRKPDEIDKETYQTVYARNEGSIAAPTAGLHFTDALLKEIGAKGVRVRELTLHVGIGTFRPVRAKHVEDHRMDSEHFEMDTQLLSEIEDTKASGKRIVTVGTTTTRAIEGFASGRCVLSTLNGRLSGMTDMFIYPGYSFKVIDAVIWRSDRFDVVTGKGSGLVCAQHRAPTVGPSDPSPFSPREFPEPAHCDVPATMPADGLLRPVPRTATLPCERTEEKRRRRIVKIPRMVKILCAVQRRRFRVGAIPTRQWVAPAGSNRSGGRGNESVEASGGTDRLGRFSEHAGRNVSER